MITRARELSDDPLHSFLIFLKLYAEAMEELVDLHPGCFVATVSFQDQVFDKEVRRLNNATALAWRKTFITWLEEIAAVHPPRGQLQAADLADAILAFTYGGMTLDKRCRTTAPSPARLCCSARPCACTFSRTDARRTGGSCLAASSRVTPSG